MDIPSSSENNHDSEFSVIIKTYIENALVCALTCVFNLILLFEQFGYFNSELVFVFCCHR